MESQEMIMKKSRKNDDRDYAQLAIHRLSSPNIGRFVVITENKEKDHFGTIYSDELEDAIELLEKSSYIMEKEIDEVSKDS